MIEQIKQALIDSDLTPHDLRIALDIINELQMKEEKNENHSTRE